MQKSFTFTDIDGIDCKVEFEIVKQDDMLRPFGVCGSLWQGEHCVETVKAEHRYFTLAEAETAVDMLCRLQVTPCTLDDVI